MWALKQLFNTFSFVDFFVLINKGVDYCRGAEGDEEELYIVKKNIVCFLFFLRRFAHAQDNDARKHVSHDQSSTSPNTPPLSQHAPGHVP